MRCDPVNLDGQVYCFSQPFLKITAADTKSGGRVKSIQIIGLSDKEILCEKETCEAAISDSGNNTLIVSYWAGSTFGDFSIHHFWRLKPDP